MSKREDDFSWRQSLEKLGQAAMDLITGIGGNVASGEWSGPSAHEVTETRAVSDFTRVQLSGFGTLNIAQTGEESLSITADESVMPHLTAEVIGGTLELGVKPGVHLKPVGRVTYTVTVRSLEGLRLTGAGMISATNIHTASLATDISGAGDLTLTGSAQSQTVRLSGAGNYHAREFETDTTEIRISGAGNARVSAKQSLNVTLSGAGTVTYYGSPQVSQRITGIGSVKPGY